jgi:hypothetical protein
MVLYFPVSQCCLFSSINQKHLLDLIRKIKKKLTGKAFFFANNKHISYAIGVFLYCHTLIKDWVDIWWFSFGYGKQLGCLKCVKPDVWKPSNIDSILIFTLINTLINTEIIRRIRDTYFGFFGLWLLEQPRWRHSKWRHAFSQQLLAKRACSLTSHVKILCTVQ